MKNILLAAALCASSFAVHAAMAEETPAAPVDASDFLRTMDKSGVVSLEVAAREFKPASGKGPTVWLVGVAHVADVSLYRRHQDFLADFDVVLYESVMPAGALDIEKVPVEERASASRKRMEFLGSLIERYYHDEGEYPRNLEELTAEISGIDSRLVSVLPGARRDAWGNELAYSTPAEGDRFTLLCLGADNAPGGNGDNADIAVTDRDGLTPIAVSSEGGLQAELADTLGLAFQLTALSYAQPNFRASDMTLDQLARSMKAHELDIGDLEGALDATSIPAQLMKALLRFVKMADQMLGGGIADVCRLAIIEILGNEEITEQAMAQFGDGFGDVIVGERNQVVIDDLKAIVDNEHDVKSVAIYYGAAHMPDFVEKLHEQLGYEPSDAEAKWFEAMRVDLNKSAMPRRDLEMMRGMLRKSLRDQMRAMNRQH